MRFPMLAVCVLAASCSVKPTITVINETDRALGLHVENRRALGLPDKIAVLPAGKGRSFQFDQVLNWRRVVLRIENCDYAYTPPEEVVRRHIRDVYGVAVRDGDDGVAYIVLILGRLDAESRFQQEFLDKFPVFPVERTCGAHIAVVSGSGTPDTAASARV